MSKKGKSRIFCLYFKYAQTKNDYYTFSINVRAFPLPEVTALSILPMNILRRIVLIKSMKNCYPKKSKLSMVLKYLHDKYNDNNVSS